jgi:prepilin-type processing-associated H-X9-DG protein
VSDQYSGHSGPCAGCGKTITVPPRGQPVPYVPPKSSSAGPVVLIVVLVLLLVALACVGMFVAVPVATMPQDVEGTRRSHCANNLKQIGLAMHAYHDEYGCFPPAYVPDEDGKPMHSWRVLLLPYLEQNPLYDQYNFDEPWNSAENLALAHSIPSVYQCPSDTLASASETSYLMIVGPGTLSDGPTATKIAEITDGTANTILLAEASGCGVHWLKPEDLDAEQLSYFVNDPVDRGIASEHPAGANFLFCDGAVVFVDAAVDPEVVEPMSTISGGELVDRYSIGY